MRKRIAIWDSLRQRSRKLISSDFDFELPEELIAQAPTAQRDASRLMVVDRAAGTIAHKRFSDIVDLIPPDDLLVLNTTRVFRARLLGTRDTSGAPAEVFLLKPLGDDRWEAMVQPGNKLKPGRVVHVADGFDVEVLKHTERGTRIVRLITAGGQLNSIERYGHIPLPPYIERADSAADADRYQTVYASESGSVAAPTAGLHFTAELLHSLDAKRVRRADVLLHVGPGTFKPVEVDDPKDHVMHEEWFRLSEGTATAVNHTRDRGAKVWAVGTTSLRTLESVVDAHGRVHAAEGETSIFIYPPHIVRGADRLVTNFHLPRSTLLMLVMAFAGVELIREAYAAAISDGYRFYSYGDAMVIL